AWIVGGATFAGGRHRRGKPGCESESISQLDQQASPGMRDDPFGVRPDFYGLARRVSGRGHRSPRLSQNRT
ncbi:MAG TPA: hypothetical protein VFD74_07035, partial [Thermoleophilia bacterium]|nr:hypothetical protein [Thermoleophilia bacterium]